MTDAAQNEARHLQPLLAELPRDLLAGRRVLITGAARGLGLAFAKAVAHAGAQVAMVDILADQLAQEAAAVRAAGAQAHAFTLDLCDCAAIPACVDAAVAAMGGLDGLVNNAAITNSGGRDAHALAPELWVIPEGGTPVSLGQIGHAGEAEMTMPPPHRLLMTEGATLAITMEPVSKTPHPAPSSVAVASGKIITI